MASSAGGARARDATNKKPNGSQILSDKSAKALKSILLCIAKKE